MKSAIHCIVIGTAGHIDHGKSSLVRALTGIDPDRLPEEKARGLTIDLGFAPFTLTDGTRVGIVDVPGHERFIKNMVAGATGIDFVILVVAADDGVMPQTLEHLQIMHLLGVRRGVIAITKIDLVERELVDLVEEEIRETVAQTFLAEAPIFKVSTVTQDGLAEFQQQIMRLVRETQARQATGVFRMPIQRVFSAPGFGAVVTGIPISGKIQKGQRLEILPPGFSGKVRGLQAYKEQVDSIQAGHSSAINLSDIDYQEVHRGMVVVEPNYFHPVQIVEAKLQISARWKKPIPDRSEIRLHVGTSETLGVLVLLDRKALQGGEEAYVQLRLREPIVVAAGDHFILRLATPPITVGGGQIISLSQKKLKSRQENVDQLARAEQSLQLQRDAIVFVLERRGMIPTSLEELQQEVQIPRDELPKEIAPLIASGEVLWLKPGQLLLHQQALNQAQQKLHKILHSYFQKNPHRLIMELPQLRAQLRLADELVDFLLTKEVEKGMLSMVEGKIKLPKQTSKLAPQDQALHDKVLQQLQAGACSPPSAQEIAEKLSCPLKQVQSMLALLVDEGTVIRIGSFYFAAQAVDNARQAITANIQKNNELDIPSLRDQLNTTRKFLIPLLEYFDATGLTQRQGTRRILRQ